VKVLTSQDPGDQMPPNVPNEANLVIAPEVQSLAFSYFDGQSWQESWDSTTLGADGVTPIGPPRAIAVTLAVASPKSGGTRPNGKGTLRSYRHVVAIPTANGPTQQAQGGTTP